ncbi:MAG: hypothetical protein M3O46_06100, partial [Myxococcota bacterium]|nr:hypothetical protein [Myxococcota bacterium]
MRRFAIVRLFSTAILALECSGCSFLFVKGPPSEPENSRLIECTSSRVAPAFDALFGGLEVIRTGVAVAASDSSYQNAAISRGADIGFGVAFSALF